ncbi:tetratricopeptide repeat protein [Wohlfahrtiimonas populi]|uniref:tetratricopeptide repeat protein n=1 Tax=Wohlfahrtiimonas populi TaxID=1940240 RepID=UPI0013010EE1|nr:tetratricopeptide repeat protein [Wohlfahrtiimonas populi]
MKKELNQLSESYGEKYRNQQMRRNFVLKHDHQYGEFIFPKGTLINRYDPSDDGEETYPLILSGFNQARFAEPVKIAGVMASATDGSWVELAEDQAIGPVHFYSSKFGEYGGWMVDRTTPTIFCRKGSVALFEKPSGLSFNTDDEYWWKAKDGAEAHFKPSEWQFRYCDDSHKIEVLPAYGTAEAIALEKARAEREAEEDRKFQPVVKDGVLMDAEPIEFTISFYLEGLQQYMNANYSEAYQSFLQAAEYKEKGADYYLGIMNYHGQGTAENREEALKWLNQSVEAGNSNAVAKIGQIYFEDAEMKDYDQALAIFNEAAQQGNLVAEFYLGLMYTEGLGVGQNYPAALSWFKKASHPMHDAGMTGTHDLSIQAMINIGRIYSEGLLGEKDPKAAEPWLEKACYLDSKKACELWEAVKQ